MTQPPDQRTRWRFWRAPGQAEGDTPVARKELDALGTDASAALAAVMKRYKNGNCTVGEVKPLGKGLIELRVQLGSNPYRLIFFRQGSVNLAVLAIYKNQQKTPKLDLDKALARKKSWEERSDR